MKEKLLKKTPPGNRKYPAWYHWLAQINGRDLLQMDEKLSYDYAYLKSQTITLDIKIMFLTVVKVFQRRGISH